MPTELGSTQGQTHQRPGLAGLRRERLDRPGRRLGDPLRDRQSGCKVNAQIFGTSDEAFTLFSTNPEQFDVISASGDASLRLVRGGFVQPVNLDLFKSYPDIFQALKNKPYNTVDGVHYGVPHGRGSNLLMWRTDQVTPAPTTWAADVRPGQRLQGQRLRRADLHRRRGRRPDEDQARARDQEPVRARRHPVRRRRSTCSSSRSRRSPSTGSTTSSRWTTSEPATRTSARPGRSSPTCSRARRRRSRSRSSSRPKGATGWSDTWMINSKTKNLACAYAFIDYLVVARDQRQDRRMVRRGAGQLEVVRADRRPGPLRRSSTPTTTPSGRTSGTGRRPTTSASTAAPT